VVALSSTHRCKFRTRQPAAIGGPQSASQPKHGESRPPVTRARPARARSPRPCSSKPCCAKPRGGAPPRSAGATGTHATVAEATRVRPAGVINRLGARIRRYRTRGPARREAMRPRNVCWKGPVVPRLPPRVRATRDPRPSRTPPIAASPLGGDRQPLPCLPGHFCRARQHLIALWPCRVGPYQRFYRLCIDRLSPCRSQRATGRVERQARSAHSSIDISAKCTKPAR